MTGRPSIRTPEMVEEIATRLAAGEPLAVICRDEHMPGLRTVYNWTTADKELSAHIAHAREAGEEAIAASCLGIADDTTDEPASRKVRVWTRLELLKRWNPDKWGDKVKVDANVKQNIVQAGQHDADL